MFWSYCTQCYPLIAIAILVEKVQEEVQFVKAIFSNQDVDEGNYIELIEYAMKTSDAFIRFQNLDAARSKR